jgi:hypothetical protein
MAVDFEDVSIVACSATCWGRLNVVARLIGGGLHGYVIVIKVTFFRGGNVFRGICYQTAKGV